MFISSLIISFLLFFLNVAPSHAIYDPLSVPNNKVGIHLLFPDEISQAAKIVNNDQKALWGYVTIPIQSKDRDREVWQRFFDSCKENKIIPIIRVATVAEGENWVTPNSYDIVDFANFLNELKWPVSNRYVIIFNEVNRSDEYGGFVSPENYADVLNNAIDIFKEKSSDFFILPAGLDNAAGNTKTSLNWRLYIERMFLRQPDIFNKIDGWTSHAYPNPDFSARPEKSGSNKIDSFRSDLKFIRLFSSKKLPVFITETGWSSENITDKQIAQFYDYAFTHSWADQNIVAITPFLLNAQDGPFKKFSFISTENTPKEFSKTLSSYSSKGEPLLSQNIEKKTSNAIIINITPTIIEKENSQTVLRKLYNSFKSIISIFEK